MINNSYGSYFIYQNAGNIIDINKESIKLLKKLDWEITEGLFCYVKNHIICKNKGYDKNTFLDCTNLISIFVRCFDQLITKEFINRYNVKKYHINLIKRSYFNVENDYFEEIENEVINIDYKRPYGNSNVYGDIYEELRNYIKIDEEDTNSLDKINVETYKILISAFKELNYEFLIDAKIIYHTSSSAIELGPKSKRMRKIIERKNKLKTIY